MALGDLSRLCWEIFSRTHRQRRRIPAILAAALICGGLYGVLSELDSEEANSLEIAPVDHLVENFEIVAFRPERSWETNPQHIEKWTSTIRIWVTGRDAPARLPMVERHAAALARLTGLQVTVTSKNDGGVNLIVEFGPRTQMFSRVKKHEMAFDQRIRTKTLARTTEIAACMVSVTGKISNAIQHSIAYVSTDYSEEFIVSCTLAELTHSLGLYNDSELIRPSLFSHYETPHELTINDQILVRTFYDKRLRPGTPREKAIELARQIISELVDKVRAEGPAALIQRNPS